MAAHDGGGVVTGVVVHCRHLVVAEALGGDGFQVGGEGVCGVAEGQQDRPDKAGAGTGLPGE
jgi:hypothetical protein